MTDATMSELLLALAPALPAAAVRSVVERAEGIPLYAIEMIRMLVAEGRLQGRGDGTFSPVGPVDEIAVPDTLTALIAARLDALQPSDRSLTLDAAVLGQAFTAAGLAAVSNIDESAIDARLAPLVRSELFVRRGDPRSPERGQYAFVQSLIREVAYNTLSKKDRKTRHLAAARFFESLGTDEIAGALAGHYLAAHDLATEPDERAALATQARIALRGAAERAVALGAHEQAVSLLSQAAAVAGNPAEEAELLERAGEVSWLGARPDDADRLLRQAIGMHRERGDPVALARAAAKLGRALLAVYRVDEALETLSAIGNEVADLRETADGVVIDLALARAHWLRDEPTRSLELSERALALSERLDLVPIVVDAMLIRGAALGDLGRTYEGIPLMEGALRLADRHGLSHQALRGRMMLAGYLIARDPAAATEILVAGTAEARRLGDRGTVLRMTTNAVAGWQEVGEWPTVARELESLLANELPREDRIFALSLLTIQRSWMGQPVETLTAEMAALLEGVTDPNIRTAGVEMQAAVALAEHRFDEAIELLREGARLSPFNAPVMLGMAGHVAAWAGNRDAAGEVLHALIATGTHGGAIDQRKAAIGAPIAGLDGRTDEALAGYRAAIEGFTELGARLQAAWTAIDMLAVIGPVHADAAALDAARAFLRDVGAEPFLSLMDDLGGTPAGPDRQAASVTEDVLRR